MTWLHRLTIFGYVCMAASCALEAARTSGHWTDIAFAALWAVLVVLAWRNGRMDARIRQAARLSAMADGMVSVAHAVRGMSGRIGPVAEDVAVAAFGAAAEMRRDAITVLGGKP